MSKTLTIRTALEGLQRAAAESHLGLDTVVVLCEDEREYVEFAEVKLDQEENPENGAVVILKLGGSLRADRPKKKEGQATKHAKMSAAAVQDINRELGLMVSLINHALDRMLEATGGETGRDFTANENRVFKALISARDTLVPVAL